MQRGVHAHARVAFVPVDLRGDLVTDAKGGAPAAGTCAISLLAASVKTAVAIGNRVPSALISVPLSPGWPPEVA